MLWLPVERPLVIRAGKVENTKKERFLANWLKDRSREKDLLMDFSIQIYKCSDWLRQGRSCVTWSELIKGNAMLWSPDDVKNDPRNADPEHEDPLHDERLHVLGFLWFRHKGFLLRKMYSCLKLRDKSEILNYFYEPEEFDNLHITHILSVCLLYI